MFVLMNANTSLHTPWLCIRTGSVYKFGVSDTYIQSQGSLLHEIGLGSVYMMCAPGENYIQSQWPEIYTEPSLV